MLEGPRTGIGKQRKVEWSCGPFLYLGVSADERRVGEEGGGATHVVSCPSR